VRHLAAPPVASQFCIERAVSSTGRVDCQACHIADNHSFSRELVFLIRGDSRARV
jgi:hypothetical protein